MIKIFLDDQINDPSCPARHPPIGWVGVDTALKACRLIRTGEVSHISFDHDLGLGKSSGYIVAKYIEKLAYLGKIKRMSWDIHSANPVGALNIKLCMQRAEQFWDEMV